MSDRRCIFAFTPTEGTSLSINRESDGAVTVTVRAPVTDYAKGLAGTITLPVPAAQWRKLVAAFTLEPDLWPGCDCDIKQAQASVGVPHGGPLQ